MKPIEKIHTQIILDSIADGVFTVDANRRITSFNRAAESITGVRRQQANGRFCWEVFRASICEQNCSLMRTMETGQPIINASVFIVDARGERIPISISTSLLKDEDGSVIGAVETFRDLSVEEALRKALSGRHSFMDMISKNRQMLRLFGMLELVAENDATVLIEGESGTGKELFAKAIHALGPRKEGPLVAVNCGSLPETLLESELFGYKAGAFTDAKKDKPGRLALAEGGTLFLDEIGDIPQLLQVRLLRVLQDKIYDPLGGTASIQADVRIIAATHKNLKGLVDQGAFRQDLYYRINVIRLSLPPLRSRREDIPLLIDHFIGKFNRLHGKDIQDATTEVIALLMGHDFPGNIRELENIIEYAFVVCRNHRIGLEHLPDHLHPKPLMYAAGEAGGIPEKRPDLSDLERRFILEALALNQWHRQATARQLGIHPSTLWRKMRQLRIVVPRRDGRNKTP